MKKTFLKNNKGYTLLFAVLVSSIVLAVGISILTISKKEYLLSSSARESTVAFYAADSGLECAMFYTQGINSNNFATTTPSASIDCMGQSLSYVVPPGPSPITFDGIDTFEFHINANGESTGACAIVTVQKYVAKDDDLGVDIPFTKIISKGYNLGWNGTSCSDNSPKRVERAIEYTF